MSKVLIDRELAERVCHVDNSTRQTARRELRTILATPSGTPAMPVKAYYHEAPNEYGGLNKSVGLEVRKEFADAPLVLESDALARIACLEGEIAKRDEELAACRVAVENCDLFRARIAELEARYQRDVYGLNNEGDPIGGEPAGGYANDNARLRAELAALKAHSIVIPERDAVIRKAVGMCNRIPGSTTWNAAEYAYDELVAILYAAPVSEANAQGVVMPEHETSTPSSKWASSGESDPHGKAYDCERAELSMGEYTDDELANAVFMHDHRSFGIAATMRGEPGSIVLLTAAKDRIRWLSRSLDKALARLNAAPVQQVSVPECFTKLLHHAHGMTLGADWNKGTMASYHREPLGEAVVQCQAWLAAAPAAPAADAGIVDMYRHLQKVTPYRFKKIQDASITDGGDVMYFHKDRFDAALLADMAAHCAAKGVV